jgi:hypothetical protein
VISNLLSIQMYLGTTDPSQPISRSWQRGKQGFNKDYKTESRYKKSDNEIWIRLFPGLLEPEATFAEPCRSMTKITLHR